MNEQPIEKNTIERAQRGQRSAQAELLRELQDVWFRFCMGLLRNEDLARDATQETAVRVLEKLDQFRGESSIKTWSLGIALNVTREMRRKNRPTEDIDLHEPAEPRMDRASSSPQRAVEQHEAKEILSRMLGELPARQREALLLRYFEELSVEDAAAAMECATGTVKATVHQALRVLKAKLETMF